MAKSIRSKHRRRMRSVKRENFAKKDLVRLKETVMKDVLNNPDIEMSDIATVKTVTELKAKQSTSKKDDNMDDADASKAFDHKSKKDKDGQYLDWMNQRAIRKQQVKNKKGKKMKGKKKSAW